MTKIDRCNLITRHGSRAIQPNKYLLYYIFFFRHFLYFTDATFQIYKENRSERTSIPDCTPRLESFQTGSRILCSFSFLQYQRANIIHPTLVGNIVGLYYTFYLLLLLFFTSSRSIYRLTEDSMVFFLEHILTDTYIIWSIWYFP